MSDKTTKPPIAMSAQEARDLVAQLQAQLAQRDAALKAADELAHEAERRINDLDGYDNRFPVRQALVAYRKARGQADG